MLTIAVCDDNPQFAGMLVKKLRQLCVYCLPDRIDCKIISEFSSANQVLEYITDNFIHILFLDIDMPRINGFGLAEKLREKYPDIIIVFVSSYENFVFNSFEYNPFRFLRKSHLEQELPITFQKIIEKCIVDKETITFNTTEGKQIIRIKDILYFEGNKNYVNIHCKADINYKCRGTVTEMEQMMNKYDFYRVHPAFVVNLDNIEYIDKKGFCVNINNRDALRVSRRKMPEFKECYMEFIRRRYLK